MATDEPMDDAREQQETEPAVSSADAVEKTTTTTTADADAVAPASPPAPAVAAEDEPTAPVVKSASEPAQVQPEEPPQESEQPAPDQPQQPQESSESDTENESGELVDAGQMSVDADTTPSDVVVVDVVELGDDSERQQDQPQRTESASAVAAIDHHATNLLHEAVERQQKLREDSEKQEQLMQQLQRSPLAVVNPHPETVQSEAPDEEDVKTKNIPDLYYLFTNDKLKEEPLTKVLNSDPFCIPRLTDNVPEYRPAFNPLSILEGEEKLLPRYFRLDPYEGIPGVGGKSSSSTGAGGVVSQREKNARDRSTMSSIPIRAKQVSSGASAFKGKTSTFMGTLPRQSEFSEIPVSDTIFQTQKTFRPTPPPPPAPHPSYASKTISSMRAASEWEAQQQQGLGATSTASGEPITPTALTDAIFLTSLHQSDSQQHSNTAHSHAHNHADHQFHDYYASKEISQQQHYSSQALYEQEQRQQMYHRDAEHDQHQQQQPEKLTRYLPSRAHSSGMSDHAGSPTPYMDEASYLVGHHHQHHQYQHEHHSNSGGGGGQYLGSMFDDYRDSESHLTDPMEGRASSSSMYGDDGSASSQFTGGGGGDNQSLQPIPKKPRSKNVFRPCTAPGCTKGARGKSGLCQKHGGGKRCAAPNCSKGAQGSSAMCLFHGGGYRCTVDGCSTGARGTSGLCAKHGGYKRGKEPGGGGASPASSNGGNGKRARTQHSPMDFDDHNDQAMDGLASFSARERVM